MIVKLNPKTKSEDIERLIKEVEDLGVSASLIEGFEKSVIGLVGDTTLIDEKKLEANKIVEKVTKVQEPFKKANRMFHPLNSVYDVLGEKIGGEKIALIAGPCSVESEEQITNIASSVKMCGAGFLRGGAFKPRTSPYSFQGLELQGLELPIVTEIMSTSMIEKFNEEVDIIQVGARNMQNFDLLKELGKIKKPILLKRGLSATIEELLMSAEYIMAGGNEQVILCERGVRTFENYTRNTLDLSAIPVIKKLSHLPIIIDPSHATGKSWMVEPLSKAAIAAGADGLIIEVHNDPKNALCDGQQSITPEEYKILVEKLKKIANAVDREI